MLTASLLVLALLQLVPTLLLSRLLLVLPGLLLRLLLVLRLLVLQVTWLLVRVLLWLLATLGLLPLPDRSALLVGLGDPSTLGLVVLDLLAASDVLLEVSLLLLLAVLLLLPLRLLLTVLLALLLGLPATFSLVDVGLVGIATATGRSGRPGVVLSPTSLRLALPDVLGVLALFGPVRPGLLGFAPPDLALVLASLSGLLWMAPCGGFLGLLAELASLASALLPLPMLSTLSAAEGFLGRLGSTRLAVLLGLSLSPVVLVVSHGSRSDTSPDDGDRRNRRPPSRCLVQRTGRTRIVRERLVPVANPPEGRSKE